ncbi:MAG: hypothetical protein QOH90_1421 [Actinomycetota bacterium]|jgi:RNA polymerase sigma-70 factor (ECF subfamily)|nr:hypothetical protein [Actinomycetota bacterium]
MKAGKATKGANPAFMRAQSWGSQRLPDPSDRDLVQAFQSGDEQIYEEIYKRYADRVRHICRRILGNGGDAEEAAQEAFLRAYTALGRFNGQYQLGAWLARIAANVCFDHLRQRTRTISTTELSEEGAATLASPPRPEATVEAQMTIKSALNSMQPLHGEALFLRAVEGLSHNEMAERLNMSAPQVKALLHRARTSFKKAWQNASGWGVAFLLQTRARVGMRIKQVQVGGAELLASPTSASLVAERVATSAVVVALALSGTPGLSSSPGPERVAQAAPNHRRARLPGAEAGPAPRAAVTETGEPADVEKPAEKKARKGLLGLDLPLEVARQVQARKKDAKPKERSEDKDQGPGLPQPAEDAARMVEEVVKDLPPH